MNTKKKSPTKSRANLNKHNEDSKFLAQLERVYDSFYAKPQTMKECDIAIGVMRENICRHCKKLRQNNQLYVVGKRLCQITKHRANIYSTNPEFEPKDNIQLSLWGGAAL